MNTKYISKIIWLLFIYSLPFSFRTIAQQSKIDSLENILKSSKQDTGRVSLLSALSDACRLFGLMEKAHVYGNEGIALAKKIGDKPGLAVCYNRIGNNFLVQGDYKRALAYDDSTKTIWEALLKSGDKKIIPRAKKGMAVVLGNIGLAYQFLSDNTKALEYQMQSLKIREEMNDKAGMGTTFGNIGLIYFYIADYPKALDYQLRSLTFEEEMKHDLGVARTLGNIGGIYVEIADYPKALDYLLRCLSMSEKLGNKQFVGNTLSNIGAVYQDLNNLPKALEYQQRALKVDEEIGDKRGSCIAMNNIGSIYASLSDSECVRLKIIPSEKNKISLEYQQKSLKASEEIGDRQNIAVVLTNMSSIFLGQKKYSQAFEYGNKAYAISHEIGDLYNEKDILLTLYKTNKAAGSIAKALEQYEKYIMLRDSIVREEKQKDIMKKQMEFDYEKKENAIKAEHEKEKALSAVETKRQKLFTLLITAIAMAILIIAFVILRSLRITRKQKSVIEIQKNLVDEKNKHITDSINYAKRIQESILLSDDEIKNLLPFESFIFYKPKDIVSGDFYWMTSLDESGNKKYVIAAADCTGHGVPGGFLSMIGNMLLNEVVNEKKITNPSEILKALHEGMYHALHHENESAHSQDGMDIALCTIDVQKNTILYAGAGNPLYIIHENENRLEEFKPESISIGDKIHRREAASHTEFLLHQISVQKGTRIYLFSDGYLDQFSKKLKQRIGSSNFKKLILDSSHLSMSEQKKFLVEYFSGWMGLDRQVDDVLVIGIKI